MIIGLHHVQITIPQGSEEQGKAFYCQVLGLQELEKPGSLKGRGLVTAWSAGGSCGHGRWL